MPIQTIQKRDGRVVDFAIDKIAHAIFKSQEAVGMPDFSLAQDLGAKVGVKISEIFKEGEIPKVEQVQDIVEQVLVENGQARVAKAYILYRQKRTEVRKQKQQILQKEEIDEVDKRFDLNALRVLCSRYLKKNDQGEIIESPRQLFERVSMHTFLPTIFFHTEVFQKEASSSFPFEDFDYKKMAGQFKIGRFILNEFHLEALKRLYDRFNKQGQMKISFSELLCKIEQGDFNEGEKEIWTFFQLMAERKFFPNTPALVNFGNYLGMGSACFALGVEDSIESIMEALWKAAIIFKSGGGVGYNFSKLRPEGDFVKSTGGISSGPLSFMSLFDKMTDVIKQGGVRRGASMGILDIDHPDIEKFITAKRGNGALRNFNISVFVKKDFWEYYENKKPYPLKNPKNGEPVKFVDPQNLFDLIVYQAWESAEPGLIFEDTINDHNPFLKTLGPIKCTNPCITDDNWVMTSNGPRQVKELINKKTEVVVSGEKWSNHGSGFFSTGIKKVFKLETQEGFEISLTGNHPIRKVVNRTRYQVKSDWAEVQGLKEGDEVLLNVNKNFEWPGDYTEKEGYLMGVNNKEITPLMEKASSDFYKGFLRGFFDTDGSVQGDLKKGVSVRLAQSDLDRLKAVQRMLLRLGIFSRIYLNRRKAGLRNLPDGKGGLKLYNVKAQHELEISCENLLAFAQKIGFEHTDKKRKLDLLLQDYSRKLNKENFVTKVKRILYLGEKEVYDIQVPGINAFDTNGFLIHNCGEIPLYEKESCNLGSINIWSFCKSKPGNGKAKETFFDWQDFQRTIEIATRFLDNVVDVNKYPLPDIEEATLNTRKIGLGLMGLADVLFELGLPYNSFEGLDFMAKLMEFLNFHSKKVSCELARERGVFPYFEKSFFIEGKLPFRGTSQGEGELPFGSKFGNLNLDWEELKEEIKKYGLRNGQTTTNAPTGSISMIAGVSSGIEPNFSLVFEKKVTIGSFYYVNPVFEKVMSREGLFDEDLIKEVCERSGSLLGLSYIPYHLKRIFVTAMDIKAEDHIRALSTLQNWTDSSISKTINFPSFATVQEMKEAFLLGYQLGCKDLTVFRDKSIVGVLSAGTRSDKEKEKKDKPEGELVSMKDEKAQGGPIIYHDLTAAQAPPMKDLNGNSSSNCNNVSVDMCPKCQIPLVRQDGCKKCPSCGYGICGG